MPSEKILAQKQAIVADLAERMQKASSGVLVDYKGVTVAEDTQLRRDLRASNVSYAVVKNSLLHLAAEKAGLGDLDPSLSGTTALAMCGDPVAPAKGLCAAAKRIQDGRRNADIFKIKAGFVDGRVISPAEVKALAELPAREVLVARALAGFNAPITGLVNVLNGNLRGLVVALNAIAEKKGA